MRTLDLFAGAAAGWSLGLHRAGFETVAACEIDPWRRACFANNFPRARMYEDVKTLTAARLLSDLGYLPEIIVGSPPCQAVGPEGYSWNGGPLGSYRMAAGVSPGLARRCIAAYGDAVVPQIAEALGRCFIRLMPFVMGR
jgi:hypothetical protein